MTADTPCANTQVRAPSPHDRKRYASGQDMAHMTKAAEIAPEVPQKKAAPVVANNGWGELFQNKENFVEMHLC